MVYDKYHIVAKVKDLETRHYRLLWGNGPGRGTFIIERMADGATTWRATGWEALMEYRRLVHAFNISGAGFDELCAQIVFTE